MRVEVEIPAPLPRGTVAWAWDSSDGLPGLLRLEARMERGDADPSVGIPYGYWFVDYYTAATLDLEIRPHVAWVGGSVVSFPVMDLVALPDGADALLEAEAGREARNR